MSFESVIATINGGLTTHWFKCNDASGTIVDSGDDTTRSLSIGIGTGSLTYDVTGSEASGTSGKAISFPHDKSRQNDRNEMFDATTFSMHIAFKTINNAANMDSVTGKICSIADDLVGTPECAWSANRNSDSNGILRFFCQGTTRGTDVIVNPADFPGSAAWDDDNWHYYVGVQRGDGNGIQIYIDGVLPTQTQRVSGSGGLDDNFVTSGFGNTDNMCLGGAGDDGSQLKCEGVIDNNVWWRNYALTAVEVTALFDEQLANTVVSTTRRTGRRVYNDDL